MDHKLVLMAFTLIIGVQECRALRILMLDVPAAAYAGESVELTCIYELEKDRLYSIKWYRDEVEFYRYVPMDWPPGQFLPLPGVRVDLRKSGERTVYLRSVDLNSVGTYRCEVSAEAPSFQSVEAEAELKVMVLPTVGPHISGGQNKYDIGDTVEVNCTSAKSKPASTLRWYINDQPVSQEFETEFATTIYDDGLESSALGLKLVVKPRHFSPDGSLRLKCTAAINRHYTMSNEEHFSGGRQQSSPLSVSDDKPSRTGSKKKSAKQMSALNGGNLSSLHHWLLLIACLLHYWIIT